ncbi:MAG: hypothetical protein Kow0090_12260 [Myxococcota bacterium]
MNKRNFLHSVVVAALFSLPASAFSFELDGHLQFGGGLVHVADSDFQAASESQSYGHGQLELGVAVFRTLEAYLMFAGGTAGRNYVLSSSDVVLDTSDLELGARYYYPLFSFLDVYARLGLRYQSASAGIGQYIWNDDYDDERVYTIKGDASSFGATFGLGFALILPRELYQGVFKYDDDSFFANSTAGIYTEFGGILQGAHKFGELKAPEPESGKEKAMQVSRAPINFGETNLSGFYWRIGLILYY